MQKNVRQQILANLRSFQGSTSLKVPLNITNNDDYILIESSAGVDYWVIMEGISILFSMPEFKDKNDIWVFKDGQLKMLYSDLYNIKDKDQKPYPEGYKGTKTSIITED
jgi:hypothetical protein